MAVATLSLRAADSTATAMNRFAGDLYHQTARASENLVFSPFANAAALSMLLDGAAGQTAAQLAKVLHQPYPDPAHYSTTGGLIDQINGHAGNQENQLFTARGLFIQQGFPIRSDYERILEQYYHAAATQYDFAGKTEQARVGINFWAAQQTKGKIQELFGPGTLGSDVRMVLTSAIYFHGMWASQFRFDDTRPEPFHASVRQSMQVDTMNQTGTFGYAETPSFQVLEMKYGKSPVVCDILLPKPVEGLASMEALLTADKLAPLWSSLASREVAVSLPRFRLESDISMKDVLQRLGVSEAFKPSADFSKIDDRRDLVLTDLRHKAMIEVNEQGTIAAAVSGSSTRLVSATQPATFRADHPFMFVIRDTHSGVILFQGRVVQPKP
jgi:serpin B